MSLSRRDFIRSSAVTAGSVSLLSGLQSCEPKSAAAASGPLDNLKPFPQEVPGITVDERKSRIEKAQQLMVENKINAIFLDGGTSMEYFTGIRWGTSERMMAAIIPDHGDIAYVGPHFEEERIRELMTIGTEVRVWEEHESPYQVVAGI
ncbi:MAG: aminopeptidase P family N-terminal domain-containing protein, partial [Cyclobacteriaceae bacterium]